MDLASAAIVLFVPLAVLLVAGIPIGLAMAAAGSVYLLLTLDSIVVASSIMFSALDKAPTLAIPFFILSAEILSRGGAIRRLVETIDCLIGHLSGGLAITVVLATMVFSAICGSSIATAAAIGVVSVPELLRRGYGQRFSVGLVATSGGLGILIPPSIPLIIYGLVTNESISDLFLAGIVPGFIYGMFLCLYVVVRTWGNRAILRPRSSWPERRAALRNALDIMMLPVLILGSIYGGIFTPTEASAAAVIFAVAITYRQFRAQGVRVFVRVVASSCITASALLFVIAGAAVFGYSMTASGIPEATVRWIKSLALEPYAFLIAVNLILLVLGMFFEVISIMLITLPIFFPIVLTLGIDPIHFAIIVIINMEIAAVTPPIGLNLFTLSAISKLPVGEVFRGAAPFLVVSVGMLALVTYVPWLSLVLVR